LAVLKDIVDFLSLLIGAEGTRLLRDIEVTGDPTGAKAPRRLQDLPAESECSERKSTAKFNTAMHFKPGTSLKIFEHLAAGIGFNKI
jgi:hypothetical protein